MKRLAIVFTGLHYAPVCRDWHFAHVTDVVNRVDFRQYVKNIKTMLYGYFENKGYLIDTFISTSHSVIDDELVTTYRPEKIIYLENTSRLNKIMGAFKMLSEHTPEQYDLICFTRFDIHFMKNFDNINVNKFNIVSVLEKEDLIDDNIYIFPQNYLAQFGNILHIFSTVGNSNGRLIFHTAKKMFHDAFDINYICNENVSVPNLSFFKLRVFDEFNFVINEFMLTDNYWYQNATKTAKLSVDKNIIKFSKIDSENGNANVSLKYKLKNAGKYNVSFKIKSSVNIINSDIIKLQSSNEYYKINDILKDRLTVVDFNVNIKQENECICMMFDMFRGALDIEIHDLNVMPLIDMVNSGIILNNISSNCVCNSNDMILKNINNEFFVSKDATDIKPFRWFGYVVMSDQHDICISFDIKFTSEIPTSGKFAIKTHSPIEHYTDWLKQCKYDEYTHVELPLHVNNCSQLILFIMDELLEPIQFSIKNINVTKLRLQTIGIWKPKVAVLLAGEMRNFDNALMLQMNEKYLYDLYDCDLFISTWDKRGSSTYNGTITNKQYTDTSITETQLKSLYKNVKGINIENYEIWLDNLPMEHKQIYDKGLLVPWSGKIIKCSIFPQFYKIWDANEMKTKYEMENNFKYDIVLRFRPDVWLIEPIPMTYLYEYANHMSTQNKIWTLNPPKIFYPNRVYDIFFYGDSDTMNKLCHAWKNILSLINHKFDNGLLNVDSCRSLYVQCLMNNIKVTNILRCIGDIYRDENPDDYVSKIKNVFN